MPAETVEYRQAGIGQYWILDRDEPCLIVHEQAEDGWERSLVLDADHPTGSVTVGEHGTVDLDLECLGEPPDHIERRIRGPEGARPRVLAPTPVVQQQLDVAPAQGCACE